MTKAIFLEANRTVERKKGGDQTAMQRILRWYVDAPRISSKKSSSLLQKYFSKNDEIEREKLENAFDYDVFEKHLVNAGVIDHQRNSVLIHHAHMSGGFKRENLIATYLYKNRDSKEGDADGTQRQASDHPYFLFEEHNRSLSRACETVNENDKTRGRRKVFDVEAAKKVCGLLFFLRE